MYVWDIEKCVGGLKIVLNILEHVCKFSYRKFLAVAQITSWTTRKLDFHFTVALRWKVVNISEIFHLFFFISCTFCAHSSAGNFFGALSILFDNSTCTLHELSECGNKNWNIIFYFNTFLSAVECESCHWTLIATLLIALLLFPFYYIRIFCLFYR